MKSIAINKSNLRFLNKKSEMPIEDLRTEITENIINDYELITLEINKVLNHVSNGESYKSFECDDRMIELINFIKKGNKLIPPIIRNINDNIWAILDGQHRIGLCVKLGIKSIPFLVRSDQMKYIQPLK